MPEEIERLLNLPFPTLVALASGYLAYRIAYAGRDQQHQTIDTVFISLAFAAVASATLLPFGKVDGWKLAFAPISAIALSCVAAIAWRALIEPGMLHVARSLGFPTVDRHESAWESLLARLTKMHPTQLLVVCNDGTQYLSEKLADFKNAAFGPCLLGQDGSVLVYATDIKLPGSNEWESLAEENKAGDDWGPQLRYLPASRVSEIRLRFPKL
jgi:hypothetical protein